MPKNSANTRKRKKTYSIHYIVNRQCSGLNLLLPFLSALSSTEVSIIKALFTVCHPFIRTYMFYEGIMSMKTIQSYLLANSANANIANLKLSNGTAVVNPELSNNWIVVVVIRDQQYMTN